MSYRNRTHERRLEAARSSPKLLDLLDIGRRCTVALPFAVALALGACVSKPNTPLPVLPSLTAPASVVATVTPLQSSTVTPVPSLTPTPVPTATPFPTLRRLTEPGCCTQPAWSLDSQQVIFLDKPSPQSPAGFYAVDVNQPGSAPVLLTERVLTYSSDWRAAAYPEGEATVIERVDTGQRWSLDTHGNPPALSPDNSQLIWQESADYGPYEARRTDVWLANLHGAQASEPELALSLYGGSVLAWFPDSQRWLISARPALTVEARALSVFSLSDGSTIELARAERISRVEISSGGTWVAYFVSFTGDPVQDGVWLARSDGAPLGNGVLRRRLDWFGAYQWRDDERLLVVPMEPGTASHVVWQVEASSGDAVRLTDPALTPFKIAGGDWLVSPDGQHIVFVNAEDKALWLLSLTEASARGGQ